MTAAVGWVRKMKKVDELVLASDSRLCGGYRWDSCPKILTLPRNDAAIAFAGETGYAYPLMIQAYFASSETRHAMDRAIDLVSFNGFLLSQINSLQMEVYSKADKNDIRENEFIVGGYSWKDKEFRLWKYCYNIRKMEFEKKESKTGYKNKLGKIVFAGDQKKTLAKKLITILRLRYGDDFWDKIDGFDMEPFEALVSLLKEADTSDTIGGPPQMVKIYQHMNCKPIGVYWPAQIKEEPLKNRTLLGRKLFDDEECDYSFVDPDTLISKIPGKTYYHKNLI